MRPDPISVTLLLLILGISTIAQSSLAKAYYAGKKEMIRKADCIAIVNITGVEESEKKSNSWSYRQKAIAKIVHLFKGDAKTEIEIYGMESFKCEQCRYTKGRFILFLRENDGIWTGVNWHLGIRPVTGDMVQWFKDDQNRFEMQDAPLGSVTEEIVNIIAEQQKFSQNSVWKLMSPERTELTIRQEDIINDRDFIELGNSNGFRSLRSLTIHGKKIADSTLRQFINTPIDSLNLNGSIFSNDVLIELLRHLPEIRRTNFGNTKLSDKVISELEGNNLSEIIIYNTDVSDVALCHITNFTHLTHLNLPKNLTNKGYKYLQHLPLLEELAIGDEGVSDATVKYLKNLPLKSLSIHAAKISDSSLETIGNISSLSELALTQCSIGDTGTEHLASLNKLETIRLSSTQITDNSMKSLNEIPALRVIYLYSTKITDQGLSYLRDLPNLRYINVKHTHVTAAGIANFKSRFPDVSIWHNIEESELRELEKKSQEH